MFESDIELLKLTLQRVLQLSSKLSLILHSERSLGGLGSDCLNLGPIILKDGNSLLFILEACTKYYCYKCLLYNVHSICEKLQGFTYSESLLEVEIQCSFLGRPLFLPSEEDLTLAAIGFTCCIEGSAFGREGK